MRGATGLEEPFMDSEKARETEQQGERARRPYERPRVSWEEDFEPYVYASCGKMPGGTGGCAAHGSS